MNPSELLHRFHWRLWRSYEFPGCLRILRELHRERELPPVAWEQLRIERLRQLLAHAGWRVPYYSELFRRCGFDPETAKLPDALQDIPPLTKDAIQAHLDRLIDSSANVADLFENATGGSTGQPLKFRQDKQYQTTAVALDAFVRQSWGITPWARTAAVWGADREFQDLSLRERLYRWRSRQRSLNAFRMCDHDLLRFCQMVRRWQPPYLMGYASALEALARFAEKHEIHDLRFRAIRSSAETLWPAQRELIERVLGSPVCNFYGSREVNNLAAECPEHGRLHLISTWRYVEIVDHAGRRLPAGEPGLIAVTDLSNFAMPFVRYLNEDVGRMSPDPCPCGRPSPVLEQLLGRSSDLIRTRSGEMIHGEFFTHLFYGRNDVRQFQIRQTALDQLVVHYVATGDTAHEFMHQVQGKIRERMGKDTGIDLLPCDQIPTTASGKHRFTICELKC
jgi:phenylacetate-CoA ligase